MVFPKLTPFTDHVTLKSIDPVTVAYLDLTGSGSETIAHLRQNGRITIMFCSFDKAAMIMRLYGRGRVIHLRDPEWENYLAKFAPTPPGVRQIMEITVARTMTSCGYAVPRMNEDGLEERETLRKYWEKEGADPERYQRKHNVRSIDGLPTGIQSEVPGRNNLQLKDEDIGGITKETRRFSN